MKRAFDMNNTLYERLIKNSFSAKIKEYIETNNISQKRLAAFLKVAQSTVNSWCTGEREPSLDMLLWVCIKLNIEPNYILGYNEIR